MKKLLKVVVRIAPTLIAVLFLATAGCESSKESGPKIVQASAAGETGTYAAARTKESQAAMSPQDALAKLRAGNARFMAGQSRLTNLLASVRSTAAAQYPFAVIVSCLDSRQPVELIFDQGIGDVFNARVAGNVLNDDILGSLEFACKVSGAKLILVLGHSNCGAVKGSIDGVELGKLTGLLARIKPAISQVPDNGQPRTSKNAEFVENVAEANARLVMQQIREQSPILREMLDQNQIILEGGVYDLTSGKVDFYP